MDRLIEVKIGGNHLWKDSNLAGVQGEGNVTDLRITFDEGWSGYAKSITFFNAKGKNPVKHNLTTDLLEDAAKSTLVYLCKIPPEPLAEAGRCSFVIEGYVDDKRQRVVETEMEVQPARDTSDAVAPGAPTPSQAEQLQAQLEAVIADVQKAAEGAQHAAQAEQYAADAKANAEAAASSEENAAASASDASSSAARAEQALSQMGTHAEDAAQSAAEAKAAQAKAEEAEAAATESADRAAGAANGIQDKVDEAAASAAEAKASAQGVSAYADQAKASAQAAKTSETNAATSASSAKASENSVASNVAKAETAKSNAESAAARAEAAQSAAASSASSAEESAYIAELKKEETKSNAEIAQSHATNAWGYMKTALESRAAAVDAQEAAEAAQAAAEKAAENAQQASGGNFATPAYVDSKAAEAESNANKYTDEKLASFSPSGGGGDASEQISEHNADTSAHADIRAAIPTAVSQLANDSGYLSKETDPTVPAWAKAASKPSYTASEVGADASGSAAKALTDAKAYTDQKLSTIPPPDVSGQISTHNTAEDAHADIRQIAHNAASLATSAKSEAEAASQNAEWAYDEAISKASIFYCYSDSTTLDEIDEQMENGNIVILDEYGTLVPMTFSDYAATYVFRLLDGDRAITATVDSDGWTVHEEEVGGGVPIDHAVNDTTYGKGTIGQYGHVKLSDATGSTDGSTSGIAATPLAVKTAYDKAVAANTAAGNAASAASTAQARANEAYSLAENKQNKIAGTAGQVVGFDTNGNPVAQEPPESGADITVNEAEITLSTSGWTSHSSLGYQQAATVSGLTAAANAVDIDVALSETDKNGNKATLEAFALIAANPATPGTNEVRFYAESIPAVNVPIVVRWF